MDTRPIDRLLSWAKEAGMTQRELAARMGANSQDVTNWKKRGLPSDRYEAAAGLFGRSIDELLGKPTPGSAQQPAEPQDVAAAGHWIEVARWAAKQPGAERLTPAQFLKFVDFLALNPQPSASTERSEYVKKLLDLLGTH